MTDLNLIFAKIQATDNDEQIVYGVASAEIPDAQGGEWEGKRYEGDIISLDALKNALPDYLNWSNIREMHQPSAVGIAVKAEIKDDKLMLAAKVIDPDAWLKVKENVYKGFSIGGKVLEAKLVEIGGKLYRYITKLLWVETSLVDRPANPIARFLFWKLEGDPPQTNEGGIVNKADMPAEGEKTEGEVVDKAEENPASDVTKVIKQLQQMRDECELNGDQAGAARYNRAISALIGPDMGDAGEEMMEGELMMAQPGGDVQKTEAGGDLLEADVVEPVKADDIVKAIAPQFDTLLAKLGDVSDRLARIEAQPAAGGPVLRPAEKVIAGQTPATANAQKFSKAQLDELRQRAATEPNPALRANYQTQYTAALEQIANSN